MWNLIKYELKSYFKELSILIGLVVFLNLLLLTRVGVWPREAITAFAFLIAFVSSIVIFIWNISLYNRDIYGSTGYLLFTLPQKGYSILASKMLSSLIQMVIVNLVSLLFIIWNLFKINDIAQILNMAKESLSSNAIVLAAFTTFYQYLYLLIFIYFCITISKVAIRNKKTGKFGAFVIFVVISIVVGKLGAWISEVFPYSLNINIITEQAFQQLSQYANVTILPSIPFNVAYCIFNIITFIGFFVATSYLLEHKMDL